MVSAPDKPAGAAGPRLRIPFAGLFVAAIAGVLLGRGLAAPWGFFFAAFAVCAAASCRERWRHAVWAAVALAFATLATWQGRDSPGDALARRLNDSWQVVVAEMTVLDEPRSAVNPERWRFDARLDSIEIAGQRVRTSAPLTVDWRGPAPRYGDRIRAPGSARNLPPPRNPGQFDLAAWLASRDIRSELSVPRASDAEFLGSRANPLLALAFTARAWINRTLSEGIAGTPEEIVIRAMTIGDTSEAAGEMTDAFRETGVLHLFSVSGLHVGMIAFLLWVVAGAARIPRRHAVAILIPCLFFYALITGFKPASVRAALMISVVAAGLVIDRRAIPLNSIGAAGFLILLLDPNELFNPGFQLSFTVVAVILVLALPIQHRIDRWFQRDPFLPAQLLSPLRRATLGTARWLGALLAVSIAAWIGSLPLTIYYFHLISFSAIPANLVAVPLSFAILALAMLSLIAGAGSIALAGIFNNANFLVTKILLGAVAGFAALPGSYYYVGPPLPGDALAVVTVLDCGRGGATVIQTRAGTWLIDGGSARDARTIVDPFLRSRGVNRLDGILLTHGDAGHVGGIDALLRNHGARRVLDSGLPDRSPTRAWLLTGIEFETVAAGDRITLAPGVTLEILFPPKSANLLYADDKAVAARLDAGDTRILLQSDAGHATEAWLLDHVPRELRCDVLVKGQHVSGISGGADFLHAARPEIVIATSAPFPATETITEHFARDVRSAGARLIRQDESGAVTITIRASEFQVQPFLDGAQPPP